MAHHGDWVTEDNLIVDDTSAGATPAELAVALADPRVNRALDRLAKRYSGGLVEFDDLRQQALLHVIERMLTRHKPEHGDLVAHIICCLLRNVLWARRDLLAKRNGEDRGEAVTDTGDVTALLEAHQTVELDRGLEAAADVEWMKGRLDGLTEAQQRHVALRAGMGADPVAVAAELGICTRWERRRWTHIQALLVGLEPG